ncbi:MAG: GGDEF domain-containing protein [Cellulosilyticaceae bacterium]
MTIIKEIFVNICIMFTLLFMCHHILYQRHQKTKNRWVELLGIGMITGLFGGSLILFKVVFSNDVSIDLRSIALVLATLAGGNIAVVIAGIVLILFRLFLFGYSYTAIVGAITIGVSVIACIVLNKAKVNTTVKWYILYGVTALSSLAGVLWVANHKGIRMEIFTYFLLLNSVGAIVSCKIYKYLLKTEEAYLALEAEVITDGLTKLYNRRHYNQQLEQNIGCMSDAKPLSLIVFDIDHFKRVNDTYGHEAGDEVLRQISSIAKKLVLSSYILSRIGGEEFSVIMPDTDEKAAVAFAERLRAKVEEQSFKVLNQKGINVTISLGVSNVPQVIGVPQDLFKTADQALYHSKNNGRNQVTIYNRKMIHISDLYMRVNQNP